MCRLNKKEWLINEIQTDCLNKYFNLRRPDKTPVETKITDWETIKDMLTAQNRSNWISVLEGNAQFKQEVMRNPNVIGQLCDNTVNLQEWIQQNRVGQQGLDLIQHFQATDFTRRIHLIG